MQETDLYGPVKAYLERQGYTVKAEVGAADVVARRGDEDPLIVELKTGFSLTLFHQAVARQAMTDAVYVAVPWRQGRAALRSRRDNVALARRLGIGVIVVRTGRGGVDVLCDPAPFRPRKSPVRKARLLREFERRVGDPNTGGSAGRRIMTAYRQDALRCAVVLRETPLKGALVAKAAGVDRATRIMADDHYGWFERVMRGVYTLTEKGRADLASYSAELEPLLAGSPAAPPASDNSSAAAAPGARLPASTC